VKDVAEKNAERQRIILLADPILPIRRFMRKILSGMGYAVRVAGDRGELKYHLEGIDLLVLNTAIYDNDPEGSATEVDGFAPTVEEVAAGGIPLIVITSGPDDARAGRVRPAGQNTYIARSASVLEVIFAVNELLFPEASGLRDYGRAFGGFEVRFRASGAGDEPLSGFIYNLSRSGAFVECTTLPGRDAELDLELLLPEHDNPVKLKAQVVRLNPPGVGRDKLSPSGFGVRFGAIDEMGAEKLDRFVDEHRLR
jgi:CheY-like chemotaxis protein